MLFTYVTLLTVYQLIGWFDGSRFINTLHMALCDPNSGFYFGIMENWQDRNSSHHQWCVLRNPSFYSIALVTACVSPFLSYLYFFSLVPDARADIHTLYQEPPCSEQDELFEQYDWRRIDLNIKSLLQWFLIICVNDGDSFGSHHGEMRQGLKNLSRAITQKFT